MKRKLLQTMTLCAACFAWAAQGQNSSTSPDSTATSGNQDSTGTPTDSSRWQGRLSAIGRNAHHELRGSKLMGADVKTSTGDSLGKIEDVIVNPSSGRIDFAVISYNGGSASTATATGSTTANTSTTSSSGEKLVPLPWSMLRASGADGYGSPSTSGEQPSFVFSGDKSKLDGAPSFDRNSWPDVSQGGWNQRIFSYFGAQGISGSTGGATSPGGVSTGESSTSTPGDTSSGTPSSQSPTPDSTPGTPK